MKNKLIKYGALIAVVIVLLSTTILPTFAADDPYVLLNDTYVYEVSAYDKVADVINGSQSGTVQLNGTGSLNPSSSFDFTFYLDNIVASTYFATLNYTGTYYRLRIGGNGDGALQRFAFGTVKNTIINPDNVFITCSNYAGSSYDLQILVDYYNSSGIKIDSVSRTYTITSSDTQYTLDLDYSSGEVKYARIYYNFYSKIDTTSTAVGGINIRALGFDYQTYADESYTKGYTAGYNEGYNAGQQIGYDSGYSQGYTDGVNSTEGQGDYHIGYTNGYNKGYEEGTSAEFGNNLLGTTLNAPIDALNQFVLFESNGVVITLGLVVGAFIGLMVLLAFLKMFAGG